MKTQEDRNRYAREWRERNLEKQRKYAREYARRQRGIYSTEPALSFSPSQLNTSPEIKPYKNESMKRVEKYQSRDLTLFDSRAECELHELKCDFRDYLHGKSPYSQNAAGIVSLLVENAAEIKTRLAGIQAAEKRVEKLKIKESPKPEIPE